MWGCLLAAVLVVCSQNPPPDLPVTRLSGDAVAQAPAQAKPAPPSAQVPGLPVTRLDDRRRSADLDAPQRFSVLFSEPTDIRNVLLLLVRGTSLSIAVDPGIKGTFVGELKDVTLRRAIESVLAPNGLAYDISGTVIRVTARRTETRLYDLNFLNVERTWQRSVKPDDETTLISRVAEGDALADATAGVQTLLSDAGRVHVDRRAGLAQVTDYPDRLDRVGAYVEALHIRGLRQVRLQTRVLEITLKGSSSIDWQAVRSRLGLPERSLTAGVAVDPAALQTVLAAQGDVDLVASPDLVTLNNEPAIVRMASAGPSMLTLTVIPQVSADGIVQLSLSPSWTTRTASASARAGEAPPMATSQADTVVRVMDGSTVMMSGFLHPEERTTAGGGFARETKEIVVLLTPTVVNAGASTSAVR
jgi:type II secretory pathway component GspD/PulD (secretin)